jgi:hypothetical protein
MGNAKKCLVVKERKMLKIKDNVDLKELEKYGFTYDEDWYYDFVPYNENDHIGSSYLAVIAHNKEYYKEIGFDHVDLEKHFQQAIEKIYDLIQAGLVEKVE